MPGPHYFKIEIPIITFRIVIATLHQKKIFFLPNLESKTNPTNVVKKLTKPTIPVIEVAESELPVCEKTVFE